MNTKSLFRFSIVAMLFATLSISCKKNYQAPPEASDPSNMGTITSIRALKAMHTTPGVFDVINDDITIAGIVIANDKSGNLYKEIFIRDLNKDSGCIALELSGTLYTNFPVGRKVFVKCKGLCLSDYKNMMQLGYKSASNGTISLSAIPTPLIPNYVIGGSLSNDASPRLVTASDLALLSGNNAMQTPLLGDLIQLNDYEFVLSDTKRSYADTSNAKDALRSQVKIKQCGSNSTIIVQTSGYADFAGKSPQAGNGNIISVFSTYLTTPQLIIRDTTDVKFAGPRCNLFEEDFSSLVTADNKTTFAFAGWKNIPEVGTVKFANAVFGTTGKCILANAFGSGSAIAKAWAITPGIVLPTGTTPKLTFTTAYRFAIGPTTLKPFISTNYTGDATPWNATWTELIPPTPIDANTATNNSSTFSPFVSTGAIDLSSYANGQTVYIAFKYEGGEPGKTTVIELDDIKITKN
jgi:hypothetical protein